MSENYVSAHCFHEALLDDLGDPYCPTFLTAWIATIDLGIFNTIVALVIAAPFTLR